MYFNFNENVDLIYGKYRCAIINIKEKSIFKINKKFYKILKLLKEGNCIEKITTNTKILIERLKILELNSLGEISEQYISYSKSEYDLWHLNMVWLSLTNSCNYRCVHCYDNAKNIKTSNLDVDVYNFFFENLTKKFKINCVQITGGEPLLLGYDYIESLLKIIKKYDVKLIEIYSNLSLLNKKYIKLFQKYNVQVATSFYSQYPETHDRITGIVGSQKKTLDGLDLLHKYGIKFRIGIVMMYENISEKYTLRKWLNERYNLNDNKNFDIVRPIGRAHNNSLVPKKEFNEKFENTSKNLNAQHFSNYYYNKIYNPCWGDKVCLKSDGKIYPCVMSKISFGNYKEIIKILSNKNSYRFLTKDKIKRCKNCEKRYLCFECRAMLSKTKHNLKMTPYLCSYNIKTGKF